jgi:type IV pilus assembly protein PilF
MKRSFLILLLLLVGCAGNPDNPDRSSDSGGESSARHRAHIHTDLGAGYFAQGRMAVALEEFSAAAKIDPSYAPAFNGLGLVYSSLREDDKAEANFRRSLQLDPSSSEAHNNYGTFLCSHDRVDESITEFHAALKNPLYTSPESAWLNAGICALKKGDDKNAETFLKNALQAQPGLRGANYQLAKIYFSRNDANLADKYFQQAMQGGDPSPDMLLLGVRIARAVGDQNAESSLSMLLRNKYPESEQAKALRAESAVQQEAP